jgi:hypothetical protein
MKLNDLSKNIEGILSTCNVNNLRELNDNYIDFLENLKEFEGEPLLIYSPENPDFRTYKYLGVINFDSDGCYKIFYKKKTHIDSLEVVLPLNPWTGNNDSLHKLRNNGITFIESYKKIDNSLKFSILFSDKELYYRINSSGIEHPFTGRKPKIIIGKKQIEDSLCTYHDIYRYLTLMKGLGLNPSDEIKNKYFLSLAKKHTRSMKEDKILKHFSLNAGLEKGDYEVELCPGLLIKPKEFILWLKK